MCLTKVGEPMKYVNMVYHIIIPHYRVSQGTPKTYMDHWQPHRQRLLKTTTNQISELQSWVLPSTSTIQFLIRDHGRREVEKLVRSKYSDSLIWDCFSYKKSHQYNSQAWVEQKQHVKVNICKLKRPQPWTKNQQIYTSYHNSLGPCLPSQVT